MGSGLPIQELFGRMWDNTQANGWRQPAGSVRLTEAASVSAARFVSIDRWREQAGWHQPFA